MHSQTFIDFSKFSFWVSIVSIAFSPFFWNAVGRWEHNTRNVTRIFKNKERACYVFAGIVFCLGLVRDFLFVKAISEQPTIELTNFIHYIGVVFFIIGSIFVGTSMTTLGIHGTYSGDHFKILMKERVTSFPFNVVDNPMYIGSTLCFLSTALHYNSPAGIVLSGWVALTYTIGVVGFEEEFTKKIYTSIEA